MYTFECKPCDKTHEIDMKISEYKTEQNCPDCGELMDRVYGSFGINWQCGGVFGKSK